MNLEMVLLWIPADFESCDSIRTPYVAHKGLDGQMVESVVLLVTMCQFLCMMAVACLPMSEKGVIMGRILASVCGVRWEST